MTSVTSEVEIGLPDAAASALPAPAAERAAAAVSTEADRCELALLQSKLKIAPAIPVARKGTCGRFPTARCWFSLFAMEVNDNPRTRGGSQGAVMAGAGCCPNGDSRDGGIAVGGPGSL